MRKRTIKCAADTIFWYVVYLLPIIIYLFHLFMIAKSGTPIIDSSGNYIGNSSLWSIYNVLSRYGLAISIKSNPIYLALESLFSRASSILPFFSTTSYVTYILAYYVSVYIVHLAVDFLLFIPKLCMKFMNHFTNTED